MYLRGLFPQSSFTKWLELKARVDLLKVASVRLHLRDAAAWSSSVPLVEKNSTLWPLSESPSPDNGFGGFSSHFHEVISTNHKVRADPRFCARLRAGCSYKIRLSITETAEALWCKWSSEQEAFVVPWMALVRQLPPCARANFGQVSKIHAGE